MLDIKLKEKLYNSNKFQYKFRALQRLFKSLFNIAVDNGRDYINITMHRSEFELFLDWVDSIGVFDILITKTYDEHIDLRISLFSLPILE